MNRKERIALSIEHYSAPYLGGAEVHIYSLAIRLKEQYDVEVWAVQHEGESALEEQEGITIRRFAPEPQKLKALDRLKYKLLLNPLVKLKYLLHKRGLPSLGLSAVLSRLSTTEERWHQSRQSYSASLRSYAVKHQHEYRTIILATYCFFPCALLARDLGQRALMIPMLHDEPAAHRPLVAEAFRAVGQIAFNTTAEQALANGLYGKDIRGSIVGLGINLHQPTPYEELRAHFSLPERYIMYAGRISSAKGAKALQQLFLAYKRTYPQSQLKLLMVGKNRGKRLLRHPDIHYAGFVSDADKHALLQHAFAVVNPSFFESLSLILLEGLYYGKPVLVNAKCNVLEEHAQRCDAVLPYYNRDEFIAQLQSLESAPQRYAELSPLGRDYVEKHYNWADVMSRLYQAIESAPQ